MSGLLLVYECGNINAGATPVFKPKCGLRQGDPSPPYLFLACMDILSSMTSLAMGIRQFHGIKIEKYGPTYHFSPFLCVWCFILLQSLEGILYCHSYRHHQVLQFRAKSLAFKSLISSLALILTRTNNNKYLSILRMDAHESLGTYLWIPIDIQDHKVRHFTPVLDKVSNIISQWSPIAIYFSAYKTYCY